MNFKKIKLPFRVKNAILAMGGQTKNTLCLTKNNFAYLSYIHRDLDDPSCLLAFERDIKYLLKCNPQILAYDLHPEYQSTKYVHRLSLPGSALPASARRKFSAVQHHHAHIASCMVENGLKNQKVIGVAFDGTGLGTDDLLWGGEFLICDYKNFKRKAYLKAVPLLGGERAIREPWRLAAIWLYLVFKDSFLKLNINFTRNIDIKKWAVLENMYLNNINSVFASSMGRLFDAAASVILTKNNAAFEAELAIKLERLALTYRLPVSGYSFKIIQDKNRYILDPAPIFKGIIRDIKKKRSKERMARRFHVTIGQLIQKICLILRSENKLNKVVLSGGVFQNKLLVDLTTEFLNEKGFQVLRHKNLLPNDSSLSLGQAAIANFN
ncbi:MAG: hypothetical protein DRP74_02800 [Candidatus Omnitrophota bacterium]|nr:MAG: hypothetical protein DRP74_02800 [Candidatus Omnitrophota bacterium]